MYQCLTSGIAGGLLRLCASVTAWSQLHKQLINAHAKADGLCCMCVIACAWGALEYSSACCAHQAHGQAMHSATCTAPLCAYFADAESYSFHQSTVVFVHSPNTQVRTWHHLYRQKQACITIWQFMQPGRSGAVFCVDIHDRHSCELTQRQKQTEGICMNSGRQAQSADSSPRQVNYGVL